MNEKIPEAAAKLAEKLPTSKEWAKSGNAMATYSFMIIFVLYLAWNEFGRDNSCKAQIQALESVIKDKDKYILQLNERITKLENFVDIKNGVIKEVQAAASSPSTAGGSK